MDGDAAKHVNRLIGQGIRLRGGTMAVLLVIEDDEAMRKLMVRTLSAGKHKVHQAENGREGLALMDEHTPDIVITDILMPQKEGIATIREVQERAPDTRIIAVSGGGMSHNLMFLDVARALGADAVLAKPFRPAQLMSAVERVLGEPRSAGRKESGRNRPRVAKDRR
jgi:CheY-like chemotaxis protein